MKRLTLLISFLCITLQSCGPSKSELRAELQAINHELVVLRNTAYRYKSQMNQAEFATFIGSFAAGYGSTSGDYGMAGEGVSTVIDAADNYDVASFSLEQIKERQIELLKRRAYIELKLR